MRMKSRLLLPAGVLAAAIIGTACVPPPPPRRRPGPTPSAAQQPAGSTGARAAELRGRRTRQRDPIASWGVDGTAVATVVIGNVVYVGGTFNNAVSPTGSHRAPRQPGRVLPGRRQPAVNSFAANFGGGPVNALATDGASLFVGGNFTTPQRRGLEPPGQAQRRHRRPRHSFSPDPIPAPAANPPPPAGVLDLAYSGATGVLYAGGDFGKIGTAAGIGQSTKVDNAAGFNANGTLTARSPAAPTRRSSRSPSAPTATRCSSAAASRT